MVSISIPGVIHAFNYIYSDFNDLLPNIISSFSLYKRLHLQHSATALTITGQEARMEVNEMRMLRWMCGVTKKEIWSEKNTSEELPK